MNNGIAVHAKDTQHNIDWEAASVLTIAPHYRERRVREAIHIQQRGPSMYLDCGPQLNTAWRPFVPTLTHLPPPPPYQ